MSESLWGKGAVMAKSPPNAVMTIVELSGYLKISRSMPYRLAQEGKLPSQKVGITFGLANHWENSKRTLQLFLVCRLLEIMEHLGAENNLSFNKGSS